MMTQNPLIRGVPVAQRVREKNADLWAPDAEFIPTPRMLVSEPPVADSFQTRDGRGWVRVYFDGSSLDQSGIVRTRTPMAALQRRLPIAA